MTKNVSRELGGLQRQANGDLEGRERICVLGFWSRRLRYHLPPHPAVGLGREPSQGEKQETARCGKEQGDGGID